MLENLIGNHKDDIVKMLSEKFNISGDDQGKAAGTISDVLSGFVKQSAANSSQSGSILDLFDSSTSNTANPLFSSLSEKLKNSLSQNTNLSSDQIGQVSAGGLDSVISMLSSGALKNLDIAGLISQFTGGQSSSAGGILGIVKNLFGGFLGKK